MILVVFTITLSPGDGQSLTSYRKAKLVVEFRLRERLVARGFWSATTVQVGGVWQRETLNWLGR